MKTQETRSTLARLARFLIPAVLATAVVSGQTPSSRQSPPAKQTPTVKPSQAPIFRVTTDIIPIDVYPRDAKGQFIPNLNKDDFQIFEDGVEQPILNFATAIGGQVFGSLAATSVAPSSEGIILPKARPPADVAGRIFIIFIDDMHFMPSQTPEVRKLLGDIRDTLLHDNDLVGFVSTGFSSVEMDPAYDYGHRRMNEVMNKVMGSGPTISDMINMTAGGDGLAELNHNINVAFSTAYDLLTQLENVTGKRKAFIWISNGYSLDPFKDARLKKEQEKYDELSGCDQSQNSANSNNSGDGSQQPTDNQGNPCITAAMPGGTPNSGATSGLAYNEDAFGGQTLQWKPGDLIREEAELIRSANRANVMFFMIDPRGLVATLNDASMSEALTNPDQQNFLQSTNDSLKVLAEQTGGVACVNMNDCRPVLQMADNMTSDYYMLGYRSSNLDPLHLTRRIEVKVRRTGVQLVAGRDYRNTYALKRPSKK